MIRTIALTFLFAIAAATASAQLVQPPYVGAVSDSAATIALWVERGSTVRLEYATDPGFASGVVATSPMSAPSTRDSMFLVRVASLAPETRYYYRAVDQTGGDASDARSFVTFPTSRVDAPVSFFFGSCQQSRPSDTGAVFDVAADLGGELFVQMGDWAYPDVRIGRTVYPFEDTAVVASYRLRLDTSYAFPRRVLSQMPIAYVWDDHDSFGDNSNGASRSDIKERVTRGYSTYVPHYALANPGAGIWQSFVIGNVEVFMLDSRSQRSPIDSAIRGNRFEPPAGHSMLAGFPVAGIDQRAWLLDGLRRSTARWKVIVSPVPFNPAMSPGIGLALLAGRPDIAKTFAEYWVGYPADVDSLRSLLRSVAGRNVVIVSGSAHTNILDDGSRSIAPEMVAANLDIPNSNLRDTLERYGLRVWTAGQTGSNNTVGRIRVETAPRHRLIMESFDEAGALELQYVVEDSSLSSAPHALDAPSRGVAATVDGRTLLLRFERPAAEAHVELFDVTGARVLERSVASDRNGSVTIPLPAMFAPGTYLGQARVGGETLWFRIVLR